MDFNIFLMVDLGFDGVETLFVCSFQMDFNIFLMVDLGFDEIET
jgi:hypothetical protein